MAHYYSSGDLALTMRTGFKLSFKTFWVTLPKTSFVIPVRPCDPIMI